MNADDHRFLASLSVFICVHLWQNQISRRHSCHNDSEFELKRLAELNSYSPARGADLGHTVVQRITAEHPGHSADTPFIRKMPFARRNRQIDIHQRLRARRGLVLAHVHFEIDSARDDIPSSGPNSPVTRTLDG